MLKSLTLAVTLIYTLAIAYVCLINVSDLPEVNISFADKIFHCVTYSIFMFLWYCSCVITFKLKKKPSILYAFIISVVFGIVIEVLQDTITVTRSLDVYDVLANTLGALIATTIIALYNNKHVKNY